MSIAEPQSPEQAPRTIADGVELAGLLYLDPEVVVKEMQLVGVHVLYDETTHATGIERVFAILDHIGPLQSLVSVYMNEEEAVFHDRELNPRPTQGS